MNFFFTVVIVTLLHLREVLSVVDSDSEHKEGEKLVTHSSKLGTLFLDPCFDIIWEPNVNPVSDLVVKR